MTLDILICSLNKGIVRVDDLLLPQQSNINYIVSFQYTDARYIDLIPSVLHERTDVTLLVQKGQGLSRNRNNALEHATSDLILFADDDTRIIEKNLGALFSVFQENESLDIAFFQASTYSGKLLKEYPQHETSYNELMKTISISAIEMICRRTSIQGKIRFDERFGLGTKFLTCGEEEVWMEDAKKLNMAIKYFPVCIVETSTLLKKRMVYVDVGVQRSKGAFTYYVYGNKAWWICFRYAVQCASARYCHFWPMWKHLGEGIRYMHHINK